jgi:hypothetical protein
MPRVAFTRALLFCSRVLVVGVLVGCAVAACADPVTPTPTRSVLIVYRGLVELRADFPASSRDCATNVLVTRVHPSWRTYTAVPMQAILPDTWQFTFTDVPVDEPVRFRINDKNWCDRNSTATVLSDVSANGVALTQNATTPGSAGDEPGFAFTVDASGQVRQ